MTVECSVTVDSNPGEDAVYSHLCNILHDAPAPKRARLDIGDICIHVEEATMIFERKTWEDLAASIQDGRWSEQKTRMVAEANTQYAYIIQGEIPSWNQETRHVAMQSRWASLVKTSLRDRIAVFFCKEASDVAHLCAYVAKQLETSGFNPSLRSQTLPGTTKRKRNNFDDPRHSLRAMLTIVPNVSANKAHAIVEQYPSVASLCLANKSDIASIVSGSRRIGPKTAAHLKEIFFQQ